MVGLSNDSDNTYASNYCLGDYNRSSCILSGLIGKWSIVALSQFGSSGLSSVSGYNHRVLTLPTGYFKRTIFGACGLDLAGVALLKLVPRTNFGSGPILDRSKDIAL